MLRAGFFIAALGVFCLVGFSLIGSSLDNQGFVREPFALLPIGYALLFLGGVLLVIGWARSMLRRRRRKR